MRFVHRRRRQPNDGAAIGRDLVEPGPSGDVAQPLAARHSRIHAWPDFLLEELLAVVVEMVAGRFRRRIPREDVLALVVEIEPAGIDDHAVRREVELAIVDHADLAANRLAVILEPQQAQYVARPRAP